MKQIFLEDEQQIVGKDFAERAFNNLMGDSVAKWYRVIGSIVNIHFGKARKEDGKTLPSYDSTIYIGGRWEIMKSGVSIVSSYSSAEKIDLFIKDNLLAKVTQVKLFPNSLDLFIDFSSGFTLHISPEFQSKDSAEWVGINKFGNYTLHLQNLEKALFSKVPIKVK